MSGEAATARQPFRSDIRAILNAPEGTPSLGASHEGALTTKVHGVIEEVNASMQANLDALYKQLDELRAVCDLTSKKAKLALEAHLQTVLAAKAQAKAVSDVVAELRAGHAKLVNSFNGKEA